MITSRRKEGSYGKKSQHQIIFRTEDGVTHTKDMYIKSKVEIKINRITTKL